MSKRLKLTNPSLRSLLTDMLPFEVPPTFSNKGFYRFLIKHRVSIKSNQIEWESENDKIDTVIMVLFNISPNTPVKTQQLHKWNKLRFIRSLKFSKSHNDTVPYNFTISHKQEGRTLSVVHPRNQLLVADFYYKYGASITYYTSRSEFSIRHPESVSKFVYYRDPLHSGRLDKSKGLEEANREYEQLGSYFVYKKYRNIHKFFESYKYHQSEKKYELMMQVDINKCFDTIYTHSIAWAIIGKDQTKHHIQESIGTFPGRFDKLMQGMNHGETNGIVIGPEFSRIFSEVVLQSIDVEVHTTLHQNHGLAHRVDYEIFRYVDDYFIFYNDETSGSKIYKTLQNSLKSKKLSINASKVKHFQKPIITGITLAKERISDLLTKDLDLNADAFSIDADSKTQNSSGCSQINYTRLIVRYKAIIKETSIDYSDVLNYTFAVVEKKLNAFLLLYNRKDNSNYNGTGLTRYLISLFEFLFFLHSGSPKVNHTVRLCRLLSTTIHYVNYNRIESHPKHAFFKFVHDNIVQLLKRSVRQESSEVENLYLIIALKEVGRNYWLPESLLLFFFSIHKDDQGNFSRKNGFMSHFSITVLLSYMANKVRYTNLKTFVINYAIEKMKFNRPNAINNCECILLFFDLIACPYVTDSEKQTILTIFDFEEAKLEAVLASNNYWFTSWDSNFNLDKELDAKQAREVY